MVTQRRIETFLDRTEHCHACWRARFKLLHLFFELHFTICCVCVICLTLQWERRLILQFTAVVCHKSVRWHLCHLATHLYSSVLLKACLYGYVPNPIILTSISLKIYWIPSMSHFSDLSDTTLNMFYINSSDVPPPKRSASPSLLYLQSLCAKTLLTACYQ